MRGYVFIENSNKPSEEENNSRKAIKLNNVNEPCLKIALSMGYNVWIGVNRNNPQELECTLPVNKYDSHTYRSLFNFKDNIIALKNLMDLLKNNEIEVIHCNTPIGGIIGRVCGKIMGIDKIIYTAHGFHFYKGAPLINRTIFKWAEMIMAHWTDAIITMNEEDYNNAQNFRLKKNGKIYYIPGIGIDTESYKNTQVNKEILKEKLGLNKTDVVCISMGDLIKRKNYKTAIEAIYKTNNKNIHYLICGKGPEEKKLKMLCKKLNIVNQIHFLGFRSDIKELLKISDIFLFTTLQEGMPRSMMEAMSSGLPCISSKIRGNIDLIEDGKGGFLINPNDSKKISEKINLLVNNFELREEMKNYNFERIKEFDIKIVEKKLEEIYKEVLKG